MKTRKAKRGEGGQGGREQGVGRAGVPDLHLSHEAQRLAKVAQELLLLRLPARSHRRRHCPPALPPSTLSHPLSALDHGRSACDRTRLSIRAMCESVSPLVNARTRRRKWKAQGGGDGRRALKVMTLGRRPALSIMLITCEASGARVSALVCACARQRGRRRAAPACLATRPPR
eukprot:1604949-Rhodomonas_salina.1